jgi:uncharacterized phage protein (TIGR01671 family)
MRELKFRAWYKNKHNKDNGWMEYLIFGVNDIYENTFILARKLPRMTNYAHYAPLSEYKFIKEFSGLMQYTGLKDKNGTEIYEGDVVISQGVCKSSGNKYHWKSSVKWIIDGWGLEHVDNLCVQIHRITEAIRDNLKYPASVEVIGNIYENPELLEQP